MNHAIRIVLTIVCLALTVPASFAAVVYSENFDDGSADPQTGSPEVCWSLNNATIPLSFNTPACMSGRTLRANSSLQDPVIGIDLTNCSGPAELRFTYYQFAPASMTVGIETTASGPLDCDDYHFFSAVTTLTVTGSCQNVTVPLTAGQYNYVEFDHNHYQNAIWIDFLEVDATCSGGSCVSAFYADFGTTFQSGLVCSIFPSLFENCDGYVWLSSAAPCGGTLDYAMSFNSWDASIDTVCMDLSSATNPSLTYSYAWDGFASLSPSIEISVNGGVTFTEIVADHANTAGACADACIDLSPYIGQSDVRFRFLSHSSSDTAYFDDIELHLHTGCPSPTHTPVPTSPPTQTPTNTPTHTPSNTPTNPPPTDTPAPTDTPVPTETPTQSPAATATPPPDTPTPRPLPATGPAGAGILLAVMGLLLGLTSLRRHRRPRI